MQKIAIGLWLRRLLFALFICGLIVYFFVRPWTPFWVDMLVGVFAVGIACREWMKARKKDSD